MIHLDSSVFSLSTVGAVVTETTSKLLVNVQKLVCQRKVLLHLTLGISIMTY